MLRPRDLGEAPATADMLFELGMMYASGRSVPPDLVNAHKWFNLAAMKGNPEAARLRREVAGRNVGCRDRPGPARRARLAQGLIPSRPSPAPELRMAA